MLYISPETLAYLRTEQKKHEAAERRRVQIAVRKRGRRLNEKTIAQLVATAAQILRAGEPTKFEYEGACRSGLRQSLVLRGGWNWHDADDAAAEVVAGALQMLGAERPSWDDGQLDAVGLAQTEHHFCARCGTSISDERKASGTAKYCSKLCRTAASLAKARLSGERVSVAEHLAKVALRHKQLVEDRSGNCEHCKTPFISAKVGKRFCSTRCSGLFKTQKGPRECVRCGTGFIGLPARRYCSRPCQLVALREGNTTEWIETACPTCSGPVRQPAGGTQTHCSQACNPYGPKHLRNTFKCEEVR